MQPIAPRALPRTDPKPCWIEILSDAMSGIANPDRRLEDLLDRIDLKP